MRAAVDAIARYDTPFGWMEAHAVDSLVTGVWFRWEQPVAVTGHAAVLDALGAQLDGYWQGASDGFDVPLDWSRAHGLQRAVLEATAAVPHGETTTYGRLADVVGRPGQARAVGAALRWNPWVLVVPCHRVVASGGALTGYGGGPARGGRLDVKAALLAHERTWLEPTLFDPLGRDPFAGR